MQITSLSLHHFRNYAQLTLTSDTPLIILTGHNGAGKTNILEALSLFSPGRGMRKARFSEIDQHGAEQSWAISAALQKEAVTHQLGTARDATAQGERRLVKIDGKSVRSQNMLSEYIAISWLTPAMDSLFRDSDTERRRFIDRLTYAFNPLHASQVSAYEKAMRERNALLKDDTQDAQWYDALEAKMAEIGVQIAMARAQMMDAVNAAIAVAAHGFPKALLALKGEVDAHIGEGVEEAEVADIFREQLANHRSADIVAGRTSYGIHKTLLQVTHAEKNMPAALCSTGEQKALLLSIMLGHASARKMHMGQAPILLLDEVVAHLDESRRASLFAALTELNTQCWLTGTDGADFSAAPEEVLHYQVEEGEIMKDSV